MKNNVKVIPLLIILAGSAGAILSSGCASTPTKESTGQYIDNSAITAKVKAALLNDEVVKSLQVNVETFKGVVQLSGFVNTAEQKARAGQIASGTPGVESVKNDLQVK